MSLTAGQLGTIAADSMAMWLRIRRRVEDMEFVRYYNEATESDRILISQAIQRGDEASIKKIHDKWIASDWRKKKVFELRVIAASYRIPDASILPKDSLLRKLEPFMLGEKRYENSATFGSTNYPGVGSGI